MKRNYYAKSKVKNDTELVCTFDTETNGLGGEILCISYSLPSGTDIFIGKDCVDKWLEKVFFQYPSPAIHYAHFAQYDWRYILPGLIDQHNEGKIKLEVKLRSETDIFRIEVTKDKRKFIMHDSYALYPHNLKQFAKQFAPEYEKLNIGLSNNVIFDPANSEHIEYAKRDSLALKESLRNYFSAIKKTFGVQHGQTVAGTAVKAWQYTLPDELIIDYSEDDENEAFIRDAYYGGVVFLTDTAIYENVETYDINSSYPATMLQYPMPWGKPKQTNELQFDNPAIYHVKVKAPSDLQIPILPTRDENGGLRWYSGEFETKVTNIELQFALLNGYELLDLYSGLEWNQTIKPFDDFIGKCRQIRTEHKGTPYEIIAKLMQNSTYGKFGARRNRNTIIFGQENIDPTKHEHVTKLHDFAEDVYSALEYSEDMPCRVEWAAFITAYSRIRLLITAYALGADKVLYGDTDSLTVKAEADKSLIDTGSAYGQFKHEKTWTKFRAIAPKTYVGIIGKDYIGKAKGVPAKSLTASEFEAIMMQGELHVIYETLPSLLVALKKGISPAKRAHRKTSDLKNSLHFYCIGSKCFLKSKHGENLQTTGMETKQATG